MARTTDRTAMADGKTEIVITGIGLVSSLGEGVEAHLAQLGGPKHPQPVLETERFAPYFVHPLPALDWSAQIPKKDQRQMETWQRLGVYTAGLALADAGIEADEETRAGIDMIVAAGGGERDPLVDAMVMDRARGLADPQPVINEVLSSELRPTLFLAQLSNLLAGNISIVHKVTGSSRTFMGEEGAGISAVQTAAARIGAGQSEICLVGGAFSAERKDLILNYELGGLMLRDEWRPVFSRAGDGGLSIGSVGAFLVLEAAHRAEARGAPAYARLGAVAGDRGRRDEASLSRRLDALLARSGAVDRDLLILSGATGLRPETEVERQVLTGTFPQAALRAYGNVLGHSFEAQFLAGIALAAAALSRRTALAPTQNGEELVVDFAPEQALVTTVGHARGEGVCLLRAPA